MLLLSNIFTVNSVLLSAAHCVGIFIENGIYLGGNTVDGAGSLRLGVIEEFPHPEYGTFGCSNRKFNFATAYG